MKLARASLVLSIGLTLIALVSVACEASPEAKRAEAASGYAAQQAECIAKNKTREDIDACRDKVKATWANDASAPAVAVDAGSDGAK